MLFEFVHAPEKATAEQSAAFSPFPTAFNASYVPGVLKTEMEKLVPMEKRDRYWETVNKKAREMKQSKTKWGIEDVLIQAKQERRNDGWAGFRKKWGLRRGSKRRRRQMKSKKPFWSKFWPSKKSKKKKPALKRPDWLKKSGRHSSRSSMTKRLKAAKR